jgi:hypothetical protein
MLRDPRKKKTAKERPKAGTSMEDWWDSLAVSAL